MKLKSDSMSGFFCVITHGGVVQRIDEVESGTSLIGRCDDSVLLLVDPFVSREHARLSWSGQVASILDLGSRNGTFVNGQRILGEEVLSDGTKITIGPYELMICFSIFKAIWQSFNLDDSTRSDEAGAIDAAEKRPQLLALTPGQRRVYDGFMESLSEKEVAARLKISIHTVHTHAKAIYKALAVSSRPELVRRPAPLDGHEYHRSTDS